MRALLSVVILVLGGCGGSSEPVAEEAPPPSTAGGEELTDAELGIEGDEAPVPVPTGPGQITLKVKVDVQEVTEGVTLRVVDENGGVAAEGVAGETFTLPAGNYQVTANVTDAAILVDTPSETFDVTVAPGADGQEDTLRFGRARIRLSVRRRGRPLRNPRVALFRAGSTDEVANFRVTRDYIAITPGRYEAQVTNGGNRIRVEGLIFPEGATQDIPVNID